MKIPCHFLLCFLAINFYVTGFSQVKWVNVDSDFGPLPPGLHVYKTTTLVDGKPFIAYYAEAELKNRNLEFLADTSKGRRLTPSQFFEKNARPVLVVNGTFFNFDKHQNLNVVMHNGQLLSYNAPAVKKKGKDSTKYVYPLKSAIGISKSRAADVAWLFTDSSYTKPFQYQSHHTSVAGDRPFATKKELRFKSANRTKKPRFKKWKMHTAIGGGPVLMQKGKIQIYNNEEMMFAGKAINDKHPRTAMGYTSDGKLIILVIQGRFPGIAEGATLLQEANILKDLGCVEALNLDGGGSSCMLVNGKETIKPSDKEGQRATPAAFIIRSVH